MGNPLPLQANAGKSFIGSYVLGMGFVLAPEEAEFLIAKDPRNKDVLFPYLNGEDLNSDPEQKPSRWVINFFDWSEEEARRYPDCFEIIERLVKPERQRWALDKDENEIIGTYALRKPLPQKWWIYSEKRPALYKTISQLDQVMVVALTSKYVSVAKIPSNQVFSHSLGVFTYSQYLFFSFFQSTLHEQWAWKYASTLESRIRYTPSVCFETFSLPNFLSDEQKKQITSIGKLYNEYRETVMKSNKIGLTKVYNMFHDKSVSLDQISELRTLHIELDIAVLKAYGWEDIQLRHTFYDLDYLPENDRIRFSIHPESRKEILLRLLKLNHAKHESEKNNVILSQLSELS